MKTIQIRTKEPYKVIVDGNLCGSCGPLIKTFCRGDKVLVVTDSNVGPLYAGQAVASLTKAGLIAECFTIESGEASKSLRTAEKLYSHLITNGYTRSDMLVALGGGVVTDLTGFVAATYQRGVSFISISTSLLADVDASVGGKTAVNIEEGKNLVGAFLQPKLVLCDLDALSTLPDREYQGGMAEVIKYGAIKEAALFERCMDGIGVAEIGEIIGTCIELKESVVSIDEKDLGERVKLNFGHTLGHGIEKLGGFSRFSHGESIAIGMVLVSRAFERIGETEPGTTAKLIACLLKYDLPTECPFPITDVLAECLKDKKREGDDIRFVVVPHIGQANTVRVPIEKLPSLFLED